MKATLNLRFDKETIEAAKMYAAQQQTSVSEIVETYLKKLVSKKRKKKYDSDELIGFLKEYRHLSNEGIRALYLKEKYNA